MIEKSGACKEIMVVVRMGVPENYPITDDMVQNALKSLHSEKFRVSILPANLSYSRVALCLDQMSET